MKTYIERKLEEINRISYKKKLWLSCDIYFNDGGISHNEQFVVWVHSKITDIDLHFRSNRIRKSLRQAVKAVREL